MPESRHLCPHCEEYVSLSTIHRHKQLYYDDRTHTWTKSARNEEMLSDSGSEQDYEVWGTHLETSEEGTV